MLTKWWRFEVRQVAESIWMIGATVALGQGDAGGGMKTMKGREILEIPTKAGKGTMNTDLVDSVFVHSVADCLSATHGDLDAVAPPLKFRRGSSHSRSGMGKYNACCRRDKRPPG